MYPTHCLSGQRVDFSDVGFILIKSTCLFEIFESKNALLGLFTTTLVLTGCTIYIVYIMPLEFYE